MSKKKTESRAYSVLDAAPKNHFDSNALVSVAPSGAADRHIIAFDNVMVVYYWRVWMKIQLLVQNTPLEPRLVNGWPLFQEMR